MTRLGNLEDIDKAIECNARAVSLMPEGSPNLASWLSNLGYAHSCRFVRLLKSEDIEKAIECNAGAVSLTPEGHANLPILLNNLGQAHRMRHMHLPELQTLDSSLCCFRKSALCLAGDPRTRYKAACSWAEMARLRDLPDHLLAYQTAMDLVPHIVWLGSTIAQRYTDIQLIGDQALEAAAAAIAAQEYTLALEWLEQGRSIVWNQTLQLRTPLDDLSSVHPTLMENLKRVANELHSANIQSHHSTSLLHDVPSSSPEQAAQKHRRLAEEYDRLLSKVRQIPGFEAFLRPRKAPELANAAQTGPVVVINVHTSRCDALILRPSRNEIMHVPLPNLSPSKVTGACAQLQRSLLSHSIRERGVRRVQPKLDEDDKFETVLAFLWTSVTKPVLDCLGYTVSMVAALHPSIPSDTTTYVAEIEFGIKSRRPATHHLVYNWSTFLPATPCVWSLSRPSCQSV
jgi:tetratricopeptide (TPR) repeat protein